MRWNAVPSAGKRDNLVGGLFPVLEIGRHTGPFSEGLGRGVDGNENDVGIGYSFLDIGGEEEVFAPYLFYYFIETGFKDGDGIGIPLPNPLGADIHDFDPVPGAFQRDDGHGRTAHIPGPNAKDVLLKFHSQLLVFQPLKHENTKTLRFLLCAFVSLWQNFNLGYTLYILILYFARFSSIHRQF